MRLRVLKGFFKKEIPQAIRDKKMAAMIFALPVFQLMLFGFALTNEVRNISIRFVYKPDDALMRRAEQNMIASKWFVNAKVSDSGDYAAMLIKRRAEVVVVSPPEGLKKALERGDAQVQLLIDATNAQRAMQIESYVKNILAQTISQEYGISDPEPIKTDIRILYNPSMESAFYMIPALMGFALCILTVSITGMSLAKEKEFGTFEKLISSPATPAEILLGKTLPYVFLSFIVVPLMLIAGVVLFGIPIAGGVLKVFFVCLLFIVSSCSVAVFVSTLAKTQQQAMMGSMMFLFPALLLSGLIFPVENIPVLARWIAYINPVYHLAGLLRNIILKGGDPVFMLKGCVSLVLIGAALAFISVKRFKSKLN